MLDTCRGLAGNAITFRGEPIERNARRANRPIGFTSARENRGTASSRTEESRSVAPALDLLQTLHDEFGTRDTFPIMVRTFAGTLNRDRGREISRKNSDETDVLLSPVETASPRKEERSFGAHRRRFLVKVETDTQGSILDHLDVHSNVR